MINHPEQYIHLPKQIGFPNQSTPTYRPLPLLPRPI